MELNHLGGHIDLLPSSTVLTNGDCLGVDNCCRHWKSQWNAELFETYDQLALQFSGSTGKNDLTQLLMQGEAVLAMSICSMFGEWHYKVLLTWTLTWLLWYAFDYVCSVLCIMLHSTKLPSTLCCMLQVHSELHSQPAWLMLPSKLSRCYQVHSKYAPKYTSKCVLKGTCTYSQGRSQLHSMGHSQPAWMYAPKTLSSPFPIALNDTLRGYLNIRSQLSYQHTPRYTPSILRSTPPSTFSSTHPCMLIRTLLISLDGTNLGCLAQWFQVHSQEARHSQSHLTVGSDVCFWVLDPEDFWVPGARHQVATGGWQVEGGR